MGNLFGSGGGGGGSPQVIYQTPPEMVKQMADLTAQVATLSKVQDRNKEQQEKLASVQAQLKKMEQAKQKQEAGLKKLQAQLQGVEAKRAEIEAKLAAKAQQEKDPAKLREYQRQLFNNFVQGIQEQELGHDVYKLIAATLEAKICFLGRVSGGKSTLINALMATAIAKTGAGRTTTEVAEIGKSAPDANGVRLSFWDIPGHDEEFHYLDMQVIGIFASMHVVVIIFDNAVSDVVEMIRTAWALSKPIVLVRTKLDNTLSDDDDDDEEESNEKPWRQVLEDDRKDVAKLGLPNIPVFGISAKNVLKAHKEAKKALGGKTPKQYEQFQWTELHHHLTSLGTQLYASAFQEREES